MPKTAYQVKIAEEIRLRKIVEKQRHKREVLARREERKAMTAKLKPIKRRIRDAEKRIMKLHKRVREDKLLLLKIRGGGIK